MRYLEVLPIAPHVVAALASRERERWLAEEAARLARETAEAAAARRASVEARRARSAWRSRWDLWADDVACAPHFEVAPTVVVWPSRESAAALRRGREAMIAAIPAAEAFALRRKERGSVSARSIQRVARGLVARKRIRPASPATLQRRLNARERRQREALERERRCALRWRQRDVDLEFYGHLGDVLRSLEDAAARLQGPCYLLGFHNPKEETVEVDDALDWFAPVATCFEDVKPPVKKTRIVDASWRDAREALRMVLRSPNKELPLRVTTVTPSVICCVDDGTLIAASSRSVEFDDVLVRAFDRAVTTWRKIARQFRGGARRRQNTIEEIGCDPAKIRAKPQDWDLLIVHCSLHEATVMVSDVVPCSFDDPPTDVGLFELTYLDALRSRPPGDDYPEDDGAVRRRLDNGRIFEWRGPV